MTMEMSTEEMKDAPPFKATKLVFTFYISLKIIIL